MDEKLSAFLDGETTRDEADAVVSALLHDKMQRESWSRQSWIREALRNPDADVSITLDAGFADRVLRAAKSAPTGAPVQSDALAADEHDDRVVALSSRRPRRRLWQYTAGLAVAASAAGFAFLVMQPMQQPGAGMTATAPTQTASRDTSTRTGQAMSQQSAQVAAVGGFFRDHMPQIDLHWFDDNSPVQRVAAVNEQPESVDHWSVSSPALANRLNGYLVEHDGLARGFGLGATTPGFVRVATYGQGPRR